MDNLHNIFILFAELFDYPSPAMGQKATECAERLSAECPPAVESLAVFHACLMQEPPERIAEIYTNTFDLQGTCYPYVGHYLFGESYKRSWFMARLSQEYREKGFLISGELPDHMAVILRFLARWNDGEFSRVLRMEGLKPAVDKMLGAFGEESRNPYKLLLRGLSLLLDGQSNETPASLAETEMGGLGYA